MDHTLKEAEALLAKVEERLALDGESADLRIEIREFLGLGPAVLDNGVPEPSALPPMDPLWRDLILKLEWEITSHLANTPMTPATVHHLDQILKRYEDHLRNQAWMVTPEGASEPICTQDLLITLADVPPDAPAAWRPGSRRRLGYTIVHRPRFTASKVLLTHLLLEA